MNNFELGGSEEETKFFMLPDIYTTFMDHQMKEKSSGALIVNVLEVFY